MHNIYSPSFLIYCLTGRDRSCYKAAPPLGGLDRTNHHTQSPVGWDKHGRHVIHVLGTSKQSCPSLKSTFNLAGTLLLGLFLVQPAFSIDWQISPRVTVGVSHSDNVHLATAGNEVSDQVLQVTPGVAASYTGPRFEADIDYQGQVLQYRDDSNLNEVYHQLDAEATGWLVPESFSLDGLISVRQQIIDRTAPIPTSTISGAGNLTDETTAYLSPRWQILFSDRVRADIRYAISEIDYDDDSLSESNQKAFAAVLESIQQADRLYWAAKYRKSEVDFENQEEVSFEHTTLETGIPIANRTSLVLLVGYEENNFRLSNGNDAPDDRLWMVGVRTQRADRYEFELLAGNRVFGDTYSFRWMQRGRQWSTEAMYTEDYVTYADARLEIDPSAAETILPGTGLSGVAPEVYLRERAQLGATLERPKTTLRVAMYDENRHYQTTNNQESLKGIELMLNWRVGTRTSFIISGGTQENQLAGTNATDDLKQMRLGVQRRIGPRVVANFNVGRTDQTSTDSTREYVENTATLSATIAF